MQIFVRTRGRPRALDYQFLGEAPDDFWWRAYRPVSDIEGPTILVRSDGTAWQAYIAGIRSRRLDSTSVPVQFNLALAGDCQPGGDTDLALSIIAGAAAALAGQGGLHIPGDRLDGALDEDTVERMLAAPGPATAAAAAAAVRAAYEPAPVPQPRPDAPDGDWIAGLSGPGALDAFTALTARLLAGGQPGRASALNLVGDDADLEELPDWAGALGVLCARPGPGLDLAVRSRGKDPALPGPETPAPVPAGRPRSGGKTTVILVMLVAAAALAVLIDLLVQTIQNVPR